MKGFTALAILAAVVTGFFGEGSFYHALLLVMGGVYVLAPALFVLLVLLVLGALQKRHHRLLLPACGLWLVLFVAGWISFGVGQVTFDYRQKETRTFVENARPELQRHFEETGSYPAKLPADLQRQRPAWLRNEHSYNSLGDRFEVSYADPDVMAFGGWIYSSSDHQWHYQD